MNEQLFGAIGCLIGTIICFIMIWFYVKGERK